MLFENRRFTAVVLAVAMLIAFSICLCCRWVETQRATQQCGQNGSVVRFPETLPGKVLVTLPDCRQFVGEPSGGSGSFYLWWSYPDGHWARKQDEPDLVAAMRRAEWGVAGAVAR